jgi:hypothetical protein
MLYFIALSVVHHVPSTVPLCQVPTQGSLISKPSGDVITSAELIKYHFIWYTADLWPAERIRVRSSIALRSRLIYNSTLVILDIVSYDVV